MKEQDWIDAGYTKWNCKHWKEHADYALQRSVYDEEENKAYFINVYAYANISSASGTPTYPDVLDGTDSDETFTSANVMNGCLRPVASMTIDNTTGRDYFFGPVSIAALFGGSLPKFWGIYVAHDTAVALDSTAGNHKISYERIQAQTV